MRSRSVFIALAMWPGYQFTWTSENIRSTEDEGRVDAVGDEAGEGVGLVDSVRGESRVHCGCNNSSGVHVLRQAAM